MMNRLTLDAETMRRLGYATVDMLVDQLADPAGAPALREATPQQMRERISAAAPEDGASFDELLRHLASDVLPYASRSHHPAYFAFIPTCPTWPGALGDFIASATSIYAGSWQESAGPSQVELTVLRWFCDWIGYPSGAGGVLTSGGSAANLTAMACAREALLGSMTPSVVAYCSDQAHSSIARAARVLGFRPDQLRVLPTDRSFRMRPDALAAAMDADVRAGRQPLFVAASAGSTNTGAVDPLRELAAVTREHGAWFHVDAAYGGFAVLTERGRPLLGGIEMADSVTLDPHKWLYQPFECGCLVVRDGRRLRDAFEVTPDYLRDAKADEEDEVNFADLGMQLSRSARALKVWLSLRYFGVAAFRDAIDASLDLAAAAQRRIEDDPDLELLLPAALGIVCFRRRFDGVTDEDALEAHNAALLRELVATGDAMMSSTRLHGRYALRLCALNHTSAPADVERVLDWLAAHDVSGTAAPSAGERDVDLVDTWVATPDHQLEAVRAVPLFKGLGVDDACLLARAGSTRAVDEGTTIVQQWDTDRDFFVVLSGAVDVIRDGTTVATLRGGEFFGEMAALDWDAGYGRARQATVTAAEATTLFVLPSDVLNVLATARETIGETLRDAIRDRTLG